jgi:hypothetical protein
MELKIGDRVKGIGDNVPDNLIPKGSKIYTGTVFSLNGTKATVKRDDHGKGGGDPIPDYIEKGTSNSGWCVKQRPDGTWGGDSECGTLTIIEEGFMACKSLKEAFVLSLTKEPQKSFRKAGITDGDDLLTDEGQKIFLSWLLHQKYSEDFKSTVVDDLLKDQDEKK